MFIRETNKEDKGLFKSIINASPDIVYIYNLTWSTFIYVNERVEKNLGYTEYEIKDLGADALPKIIYKDDYLKYVQEILPQYKTVKGKDTIKYTLRVVHKNGAVKWFQFRDVITERKVDGKPRLVLGIVQDVTDQVLIQEKLKENEQRALRNEKKYRRLFDNAPIGMYRTGENNEILLINSALLKILGCNTRKELNSNSSADFYHNKNDFEVFKSIMQKEGTVYNYETRMRKKNGEVIIVLESANRIIDESTGTVYYEGIIEDITSKRADRLEIEMLHKAITSAPVSVIITDPDGNIDYVNPKFEEVSGYNLNEVRGKLPNILKSDAHTDEFYKEMWENISNGKTWEGEFHNKKKNGELYWERAVISPILDETGKIINYLGIKEDISEKKSMFDELIVAKEKAEKSDKLKSEFLAKISHEIRTPLNSIIGFSDILSEELRSKVDSDLEYAFHSIQKSGRRIIRSFKLILNISQLQSNEYKFKREILNLYKDIVNPIYKNIISKNDNDDVRIDIQFENKNSNIECDSYSVHQIFTNILDNALKFTNTGKITIKHVLFKNKAIIEISDTGIGISKEFLPKIFDLFSKEEHGYTRQYDGSGLGLALVKLYCKINDIDIVVKSKKNIGTTVKLVFNKTA